VKFSEQNGESDDKLKSAAEQQDNACHLSEDVRSWAIEDSLRGVGSIYLYEPEAGFFKDFQIFFHCAVGTFCLRPVGVRAYAPEGS